MGLHPQNWNGQHSSVQKLRCHDDAAQCAPCKKAWGRVHDRENDHTWYVTHALEQMRFVRTSCTLKHIVLVRNLCTSMHVILGYNVGVWGTKGYYIIYNPTQPHPPSGHWSQGGCCGGHLDKGRHQCYGFHSQVSRWSQFQQH